MTQGVIVPKAVEKEEPGTEESFVAGMDREIAFVNQAKKTLKIDDFDYPDNHPELLKAKDELIRMVLNIKGGDPVAPDQDVFNAINEFVNSIASKEPISEAQQKQVTAWLGEVGKAIWQKN